MSEKITDSVEAIEVEAEKILQEARNRANQILLEAKEESKKMLSSPLPLDAIRAECESIVSKARTDADQTIKDSDKKAAETAANAEKKLEETVQLMVNIIAGRS